MKLIDARSLTTDQQEQLRIKAVEMARKGMTHQMIADEIGVARPTVTKWLGMKRAGGMRALRAGKKGRPKGSGKLNGAQAREIAELVADKNPEQLKLPFVLWTRKAVADLIFQRTGMRLDVTTVGRYLRRWGFTPQKPARRALEQNPEEVRRWLRYQYPAVRREAAKTGAKLLWLDETGIRSDHASGRTWAPKGQTPVVEQSGRRFSCNVISAISNRGEMAFMTFRGGFDAGRFCSFLGRLLKHEATRPVHLILDNHPVHVCRKVRQFAASNPRLKLIFLPPYSPQLNPVELLNNDLKTNTVHRMRPSNSDELLYFAQTFLRSTQRSPKRVRAYFHGKFTRYAAQ